MAKKIVNGMFSSIPDAEFYIKAIGDNFLEKPHTPENTTDKFSDNAGDNALTRAEINESIVSDTTANEHEYAKALKEEQSTKTK